MKKYKKSIPALTVMMILVPFIFFLYQGCITSAHPGPPRVKKVDGKLKILGGGKVLFARNGKYWAAIWVKNTSREILPDVSISCRMELFLFVFDGSLKPLFTEPVLVVKRECENFQYNVVPTEEGFGIIYSTGLSNYTTGVALFSLKSKKITMNKDTLLHSAARVFTRDALLKTRISVSYFNRQFLIGATVKGVQKIFGIYPGTKPVEFLSLPSSFERGGLPRAFDGAFGKSMFIVWAEYAGKTHVKYVFSSDGKTVEHSGKLFELEQYEESALEIRVFKSGSGYSVFVCKGNKEKKGIRICFFKRI